MGTIDHVGLGLLKVSHLLTNFGECGDNTVSPIYGVANLSFLAQLMFHAFSFLARSDMLEELLCFHTFLSMCIKL